MHRSSSCLGIALAVAALAHATPVRAQVPAATRMEKDLLGQKAVPAAAYYGVQTARAIENFPISGVPIGKYPEFVDALVLVKLAAARANAEAGALPADELAAIEKAGRAILDGKHRDQFAVDWYQGGAGTSANMNVNEVMANVALEAMGRPKGDYAKIDPHDDLNGGQSTNDVIPTALKVAFAMRNDRLVADVDELAKAFRAKGAELLRVVKMGRTELQDAVPMTVGQEMHAFAATLEWESAHLREAEKALYPINMGGTAIGTGLNAPAGFADRTAKHLATLTKKPFAPANDLIAATSSLHGFLVYADALRSLSATLSKVAGDLILLSSGPRAGLNELLLPPLQPGSSIMPGKVNPVMPELLKLVSMRVAANALAVELAAREGQLQLNAYEPLVGVAVLESQTLLSNTLDAVRTRCVEGIRVNQRTLDRQLSETVGIVTALNPVIGYDKASELAREAYETNRGILEIVRERKILTEAQIQDVLDPGKLTGLDPSAYPAPAPKK
jgi:aspartate ammonia-lyase